MLEVFETIKQVAPSRATVLIQGETGTGKELAAHAIHALSTRAGKKFIAVHCKAFSAQLLESELFGHERGAFTGAFERRIGRFEQAAGEPCFWTRSAKSMRTRRSKFFGCSANAHFERVGGNQTLQADVRLIAATNKDLAALVAEGKFRDDLYFRLNVVPLTMPPLRTRKEDFPLLAQAFLKESAKENGKPFRKLAPEAMACMLEYNWPGNVRELRGGDRACCRHVQHVQDRRPRSAGSVLRRPAPPSEAKSQEEQGLNLHRTERNLIFRALEESGGNRTEAARTLGISRRTLHRRLKELNITKHAIN